MAVEMERSLPFRKVNNFAQQTKKGPDGGP